MPMMTGTLSFETGSLPPGEWDHREPCLAMSQLGSSVWTDCAARGPIVRTHAGLALTFDGRLDNRGDLLLRLDEHRPSDEEIALSVFERWGISGLELLVGEWSLALWERSSHTLHLVRDYMGTRPLFYCADDDSVRWSSDLAELVERCDRRDALSDAFAASFMSMNPVAGLTPYEGVYVVPAGTCLSFSADGAVSARRIWTLGSGEIRYRDPRRYEEALRALWRDAVAARLRTRSTVWAEISGGLDSSSIVCMAARLVRRGGVPAASLRLVSHATLRSPEGDERRFIAEVERQVGVASEIVGVEDNQALIDPERAWVTPYALQDVGLAMVRRVQAGGGRVVLSGRLGDTIMGCLPDNSEAVFDDLARLDLGAALRNLRAWSRATQKPFVELAWRLFARDGVALDTGNALLTPRLRSMLPDPQHGHDALNVSRSKRTLAQWVLSYATGGRFDIPHHPPGIVYTYPFAHRPLVEFVLAIPGEELSAPGTTRSLMRRAFKELLPPRIVNRQSKGYYPPAAFRAVRHHAAGILDVAQLEAVQRGWIDADRLRKSVRTLIDGGGETGAAIHFVLRLERWLQARHQRTAILQRKEVNSDAVLNA